MPVTRRGGSVKIGSDFRKKMVKRFKWTDEPMNQWIGERMKERSNESINQINQRMNQGNNESMEQKKKTMNQWNESTKKQSNEPMTERKNEINVQ